MDAPMSSSIRIPSRHEREGCSFMGQPKAFKMIDSLSFTNILQFSRGTNPNWLIFLKNTHQFNQPFYPQQVVWILLTNNSFHAFPVGLQITGQSAGLSSAQ